MGSISKVGVIGAGVMGSGIAAHFANAGAEVVLLDVERRFAEDGVSKQIKAGGFMDPAFADRVTPGSTAANMSLLADADWIIEAVAERLDVKQSLYRAVDAVRKPGSIVSSNTSTIPLSTLVGGLPESFARDFLIAHFFNPPRHMRLLELVRGASTRAEAVAAVREFADRGLGKAVVDCNDTPGFIGNRVGTYWMAVAMNEAISRGLDPEEADAVIGKPFGIPSTGIFGLLDLVGIDLMVTILRTIKSALPAGDAFQSYPAEPPLLTRMIAENRIGRKSGAGFVKLSQDRKSRLVTDLQSGEYRPQRNVSSASLEASKGDAAALMADNGPGGRYAAVVMRKTLAYAVSLVPEIADGPDAVDEAMRSGYGWKQGPFELIDRLGAGWLADQLRAHGEPVPAYLELAAARGGFYTVADRRRMALLPNGEHRPLAIAKGVLTVAALSLSSKPVLSGGVANLWDLGDGVAGLEFRTKMNTLSSPLLDRLDEAVERTGSDFRALVIGSDAAHFSAGADLRTFLETVEAGGREALGRFLDHGHATFASIKYAPFPVVGAAAGLALGGGCEMLLHCDAIQAHAELSMGLVETRIGVIPGWGGCKEMLLRLLAMRDLQREPVAVALAAFGLIAPARVSVSAYEARALGFLRESDPITMNRDRLLGDAKRTALTLAANYVAPEPGCVLVSGSAGAAALVDMLDADAAAGRQSVHDRVVGEALASILTGGTSGDAAGLVEERAIMALERDAFMDLLSTPATIARVRHMLETGKPLRN
jgi:3-hydroxyacyl-CoA dehydrogenase